MERYETVVERRLDYRDGKIKLYRLIFRVTPCEWRPGLECWFKVAEEKLRVENCELGIRKAA